MCLGSLVISTDEQKPVNCSGSWDLHEKKRHKELLIHFLCLLYTKSSPSSESSPGTVKPVPAYLDSFYGQVPVGTCQVWYDWGGRFGRCLNVMCISVQFEIMFILLNRLITFCPGWLKRAVYWVMHKSLVNWFGNCSFLKQEELLVMWMGVGASGGSRWWQATVAGNCEGPTF